MSDEISFTDDPGDLADQGVADKVTNDARLQYHKLWLWHEGKIRQHMLSKDYDGWFTLVKALHAFASPFFSKKDNESIVSLSKVIEGKLDGIASFNYRNAAFSAERRRLTREVCDCLLDMEKEILRYMKNQNMLLPISSEGQELELDELESMFD